MAPNPDTPLDITVAPRQEVLGEMYERGLISISTSELPPEEIVVELDEIERTTEEDVPKIRILTPDQYRYEQMVDRTRELIEFAESSPLPRALLIRSGFGEDCYFTIRVNPEVGSIIPQEQDLPGIATKMVTVMAFAKGTNLVHPTGSYGLIGHRDFLICDDLSGGTYAFTDFKTNDYQQRHDLYNIDPTSIGRFRDSDGKPGVPGRIAIARYFGESQWDFDPYRIGLGSLIQSVMFGYLIAHDVDVLRTKILTPDGQRMYRRFGLDTSQSPIRLDDEQRKRLLGKIFPVLVFRVKDWP